MLLQLRSPCFLQLSLVRVSHGSPTVSEALTEHPGDVSVITGAQPADKNFCLQPLGPDSKSEIHSNVSRNYIF